MIQLNKYVLGLKQSSTLAINQKVKKLRSKGEKIYHFGFGQSPFLVHPSIVKELQGNADKNHYLPTTGLPALKNSIANFLKENQNLNFEASNIYIGPGSKELLYQVITLLDGMFLLPQGSWVSYLPQIKSKGAQYIIVKTDFKNNYKLQAFELENACINHPTVQKTLLLNSPNNPTGAVYTKQELQEIAIICRKYNVIVLSDEIYSQINFSEDFSPSIATYYPNKTIVFSGMSKVFSAGGYRLGFIALPETMKEMKTPIQSFFSETFSAVSAPIQYTAIQAFNYNVDIKNYVKDCTVILNYVATYIYNKLTENKVICTKPQGAFYMLVDFEMYRDKLKEMKLFNATDFSNYLLRKHHIALLPGNDFYFPENTLTMRLATVDFDGDLVYNRYKELKKIDSIFIKKYMPTIFEGIGALLEFLKAL